IYHLFKKHGFQLAGLRSFGRYITDEDVAQKRLLAERLREDPELLARTKAEAGAKIAKMPVMSKGVGARRRPRLGWVWAAALLGVINVLVVPRTLRHARVK